jgi:hypothetical protein
MRFVRFFIIAGIMSFATLGGATSVFATAAECKIAPLRPHEAGRVKSPRRICKAAQTATVAKKPVVVAVRLPGRLR